MYGQLKRRYSRLQVKHDQAHDEQGRLQSKVSELSDNNRKLKDTVRDRESQILQLRPYETDFKRYDAQMDFRDLVSSIDVWVEKWTGKFIDDKQFVEEWLTGLSHFTPAIARFQQFLRSNDDLYQAVGYPDSDLQILSAFILRFVWQGAFERIPRGDTSLGGVITLLKRIELTMSRCTRPALDMSSIHSWRGQAYHAIFSDSSYPEVRRACIDILTSELAEMLQFIPPSSLKVGFVQSISSQIVEPCFDLYEKCLQTHEDYYIDITKPGLLGRLDSVDKMLQTLRSNDIDCRNVAKGHAIFRMDKLKPETTTEKLKQQLHFICSIRPALKVREWQNTNGREETLIKEITLIAWDPDRLQTGNTDKLKGETWLSRVCAD
ncbi:hypothetical protein F5X98DRAFT_380135 [Xylaria grammica]|nr:hypothetical protein F5X98DRAFT_380135 [Xylaria grammica]